MAGYFLQGEHKIKKSPDSILSGDFIFQVTKMTFLKATKMVNYNTVTFVAAGPFCPSSTSKETRSPSFRDLKPVELMPL